MFRPFAQFISLFSAAATENEITMKEEHSVTIIREIIPFARCENWEYPGDVGEIHRVMWWRICVWWKYQIQSDQTTYKLARKV